MLQADDVTFGYGDTPVVHGVSLAVPAGGLVGLIGPNGSGKTTLLRLLAGTRRPSSGRVLLDGKPIASLSRAAIARRMAVVPQEAHLAFDYTVLEVALMGRYPHLGAFAIEGPVDVSVAREALAATGAAELESRPFSTLSGGEKQRVIIAAALTQISARRHGRRWLDPAPRRADRGARSQVPAGRRRAARITPPRSRTDHRRLDARPVVRGTALPHAGDAEERPGAVFRADGNHPDA